MTAPARPQLTDRELDVLRRSAAGDTYDEIAKDYGIHPGAVGKLASRMFAKIGAVSMPHAVLLACQAGLLDGQRRRHGDHAGYAAHKYRGEDPKDCPLGCWEGELTYRAAQRAALKARQRA